MALKLEKLDLMNRSELESLTYDELLSVALMMHERIGIYQGLLYRSNKKRFGSSSERSPNITSNESNPKSSDDSLNDNQIEGVVNAPAPTVHSPKLLSDRYPDASIQEEFIGFSNAPCCPNCSSNMHDSGMTQDSEYLTTTPKEYIIVRQIRAKYRCQKCHTGITTAPVPPRIIPGGSYGDDLIVDATLSKYCDLIPMERYCQMAARRGLLGLPPHSLIACTAVLANFMKSVYEKIKDETLRSKILLADETPHRMLEGHPKNRWYLWGFSSQTSCFFECHDTRSGDVSMAVLENSLCEVLLSDVYSGYARAIRLANEQRTEKNLSVIFAAYCNAHARRKFKDGDSDEVCQTAELIIVLYQKIYQLNKESKGQATTVILEKRAEMKPLFEEIKAEAIAKIDSYPSKSQMATAYNYFLENYEGLTRFLTNPLIPIDNNQSERLLRSHVIGRKTWYGTHSADSATTAAIHFSIVESCKMVGVNPRDFYRDAVKRIHLKEQLLTPLEYKNQNTS